MTSRVELWELTGAGWRLPIRVVWYSELAEVRVGYGAPLTKRMRSIAEEKLKAIVNPRGNVFWFSRADLEKIASLSRYEDPEDVIEWAPMRPAARVESEFRASDFIQAYVECHFAVIRNPLLATAVWASFCKFMMHWLLNERKTVDLVFAEMDAFALRRGWQGAAAKLEQKVCRMGGIKERDLFNPDPQNVADRMAFVLIHRDLTAWDEKSRTLEYTIDVRTKPQWRDFVKKLVDERASLIGNNYLSLVRELKLQLRRVIKAYAHYLEEASHPTSNLDYYVYDRASGKWTWISGSRSAGRSGEARLGGEPLRAALEQGVEAEVDSEVETLPAQVPDLQSRDENMRDAGAESVP
jgi:hypothetical protein